LKRYAWPCARQENDFIPGPHRAGLDRAGHNAAVVAFGGINHEQGGFGACRAGHHVLEELDMAGRIVDDVMALA
jgi:hypothetical protein